MSTFDKVYALLCGLMLLLSLVIFFLDVSFIESPVLAFAFIWVGIILSSIFISDLKKFMDKDE